MNLKTQRSFTNVEPGEVYDLWHDSTTGIHSLRTQDGLNSKNGFYLSLMPITIKVNNSKVIELNGSQFYGLNEGEKVTHKKYSYSKRFTKCND